MVTMSVLHQVVKAEPMDDRLVKVSFENGAVGIFDCSPYFKENYWSQLRDPVFFG